MIVLAQRCAVAYIICSRIGRLRGRAGCDCGGGVVAAPHHTLYCTPTPHTQHTTSGWRAACIRRDRLAACALNITRSCPTRHHCDPPPHIHHLSYPYACHIILQCSTSAAILTIFLSFFFSLSIHRPCVCRLSVRSQLRHTVKVRYTRNIPVCVCLCARAYIVLLAGQVVSCVFWRRRACPSLRQLHCPPLSSLSWFIFSLALYLSPHICFPLFYFSFLTLPRIARQVLHTPCRTRLQHRIRTPRWFDPTLDWSVCLFSCLARSRLFWSS